MLVALVRTRSSDLRAFLGALFYGRSFAPSVRAFGSTAQKEPNQEQWITYYGTCVQYITSLHNQFIATLSIQGALAIGIVAALSSFAEPAKTGQLASILGFSGLIIELALTWIACKLFRQHCVTCWMLARIEQEKLGLPVWAAMKSLLGTEGNRLFTSPSTLLLTVLYGLALGTGLAIGGFRL